MTRSAFHSLVCRARDYVLATTTNTLDLRCLVHHCFLHSLTHSFIYRLTDRDSFEGQPRTRASATLFGQSLPVYDVVFSAYRERLGGRERCNTDWISEER